MLLFTVAKTCATPLPRFCCTCQVVTIWYRPPEVLMCSRAYTAAVDIWSLGCVFYEMTTSRPLFAGSTVGGCVGVWVTKCYRPV